MKSKPELRGAWHEVTPSRLRCVIGGCPAIYRTDTGSVVIVGRALSSDQIAERLGGRVGPGETAVEIDAALLRELKLG